MHRSPYHGFSVEFAEHREYVARRRHPPRRLESLRKTDKLLPEAVRGRDEPRLPPAARHQRVDGATARRGRPSRSSNMPSASPRRWPIWSSSSRTRGPGDLRHAVTRFLGPLQQQSVAPQGAPARDGTYDARRRRRPLGPIFHDLAERLKKRGIVIVFSDLFDDVGTLMAGLKHFRHRRHEVIVLHVLDPAELDFPFEDRRCSAAWRGCPS